MPTLNWIGKAEVQRYSPPFHFLNKSYGDGDNKIIHGDNLLALKSLLPQYENQIKCIYIDPPYNTGNENWIYNDNVSDSRLQRWIGEVVGKEGEDLTRHDKWLCMMYPRLKLLQKLLSDDGAIFIQIDENELYNLKFICDEIFGAWNYVNTIIWKRRGGSANPSNRLNNVTDFILWYSKIPNRKIKQVFSKYDENTQKYIEERFKSEFNGRKYMLAPVERNAKLGLRENLRYEYNGYIPKYGWMMSKENLEKLDADNRLHWNSKGRPNRRVFLDEYQGQPINNLWQDISVINPMSSERINFDGQKPVALIERILQLADTYEDSIILDSFAGSGTTAHAVINLNAADGGNRKFILIELNDYAESITAERVRRIGGEFTFYELGERLFDEDGFINENVPREKLFDYIFYSETKKNYQPCDEENLIGVNDDTAYYYFDALSWTTLAQIKTRAKNYVIYAEVCNLSEDELIKYKITFRKIPEDVCKYGGDENGVKFLPV